MSSTHLPWIKTPLLESKSLAKVVGCQVYMKMDLFQPSGSFKSRGIGNFCLKMAAQPPNAPPVHFYISSGGNAGLACVIASKALGQLCTVVVPEPCTEFMKKKIRKAGGNVTTRGASWQEADDHTQQLVEVDSSGVYCPPFDDPDIWDGHSLIVDEIVDDLGGAPDAIVTVCGGGGLLAGVILGLERHEKSDVDVVVFETEGAHSLNESLKQGKLATLPAITSIATSLGARTVAKKAFELAQRKNVQSRVVTDAQAASACVRFMDEQRVVVEVSCGAGLAGVYSGQVRDSLPHLNPDSKVVVIICGGSNINLETLQLYREKYHEPSICNGM